MKKQIDIPKIINRAELARKMGLSRQALNSKLNGIDRRVFTKKDAEKAISIISKSLSEASDILKEI